MVVLAAASPDALPPSVPIARPADLLGASRRTSDALANTGKLPGVTKLGPRVVVRTPVPTSAKRPSCAEGRRPTRTAGPRHSAEANHERPVKRIEIPAGHPLASVPKEELRDLGYALAQMIAHAYREERARKAKDQAAA